LALLALKADALTAGAGSLVTRFVAKNALQKRDEIIDDALLNPRFFAELAKKYPPPGSARTNYLRRLAAIVAVSATPQPQGNTP
jgi:hypothetical protein